MLSNSEYIRQSLELHLFFLRIMKEHSFFLQASFLPKDAQLARNADMFRKEFDKLLSEVIMLANGNVSPAVLDSGEVVTPYTLKAEIVTSNLSGVQLATQLTQAELQLKGGTSPDMNPMLVRRVSNINERALNLVDKLIKFKTKILNDVLSCMLYTTNYPLLIDHIRREARLYYQLLERLQKREEFSLEREAYEQEAFWNQIMAEHSKFIRGLLDPTENALIMTANDFANDFDKLEKEAKAAMARTMPLETVTAESLKETEEIKAFKTAATEGLLACKIKSIIIPLLGDHVLREANHYLRLLKIFSQT